MRQNRKFYIKSKEKEVFKMNKDLYSKKGICGEYEELPSPILDGYDLIAEANDHDKSYEAALNEVLKVIYPRPLHSSGKDFRECDVRKSLKYRARNDLEYERFFTDKHLDFGKCKDLFFNQISSEKYESLSKEAKDFFYPYISYDWKGHKKEVYLTKDSVNRAKYIWKIVPHYRYYKFIPDGSRLSHEEYLKNRLYGKNHLWYKYNTFSYKNSYKKYYRRQDKCREKERLFYELKDIFLDFSSYDYYDFYCYEDYEDYYDEEDFAFYMI